MPGAMQHPDLSSWTRNNHRNVLRFHPVAFRRAESSAILTTSSDNKEPSIVTFSPSATISSSVAAVSVSSATFAASPVSNSSSSTTSDTSGLISTSSLAESSQIVRTSTSGRSHSISKATPTPTHDQSTSTLTSHRALASSSSSVIPPAISSASTITTLITRITTPTGQPSPDPSAALRPVEATRVGFWSKKPLVIGTFVVVAFVILCLIIFFILTMKKRLAKRVTTSLPSWYDAKEYAEKRASGNSAATAGSTGSPSPSMLDLQHQTPLDPFRADALATSRIYGSSDGSTEAAFISPPQETVRRAAGRQRGSVPLSVDSFYGGL